jgi:Rrf2 family nitric oxide-sensitive transcriptional repressor
MFSLTTQYAIRAVVLLAYEDEGLALGNAVLAEKTHIPPAYLSKVLQGLVRSGLVASRRGVGGGFRLLKAPDSTTLLDVVNAVEPIPRIKGCPLNLESHRSRLCSVHARLDRAMAQVEEVLAGATIADLLREPGRPRPLLETSAFLNLPKA